jgi:hypothetical protein
MPEEEFSQDVVTKVEALVRQVDEIRKKHGVGPCRYYDETTERTPEGEDDIVHPPMSESHPECLAEIRAIEAEIWELRGGRSATHTGKGPVPGPAIPRPE